MSDMIELNGDKESTYYQLVSVSPADNNYTLQSNEANSSDSRLYRLLTTSSG